MQSDTTPPDRIYENAYRELIEAAIEFGEADEHRQVNELGEVPELDRPQPHPVQISEAIIGDLWEKARAREGHGDRGDGSDQMKEWELRMATGIEAIKYVMENLYAEESLDDLDDDADDEG
jgi:hypothetical protein